MSTKTKIDWDAMEPDWRAGIKSKKQLAEEYGVSRAAINNHWAKLKIDRDLTSRIRDSVKAKVTRATVTPGVTPETKVTEQQVVEANADVIAAKLIGQRSGITRRSDLLEKTAADLEAMSDGKDAILQITEALESGNLDQMAEAVRKVMELPTRIKCLKDLVETQRVLIQLERQSFNIDSGSSAGEIPTGFRIFFDDAG